MTLAAAFEKLKEPHIDTLSSLMKKLESANVLVPHSSHRYFPVNYRNYQKQHWINPILISFVAATFEIVPAFSFDFINDFFKFLNSSRSESTT